MNLTMSRAKQAGLGLVLALWLFGIAALTSAAADPVIVYTYSSFASYGAADALAKVFKAQTGADVQFVATGDSREMLAKLITERDASGKTPADAFIGVEVNDVATANAHDVFAPLAADQIPELSAIPRELLFDEKSNLIPYEHGYITLVYDSSKLSADKLPHGFADLLSPAFKKSLVVEDPRTSGPGLSFLLWTVNRFGDPGYLQYWKQLRPNILTIAPSWDAAFDLFSKGEAPLMVSFSTDHAYDVIENQSNKIQVLPLENQGYRTIFGMGLLKGARQPALAAKLLDILLGAEMQGQLPETEWMFPANPAAVVPTEWQQNAVTPAQPVLLPSATVNRAVVGWLTQWVNNVLGG